MRFDSQKICDAADALAGIARGIWAKLGVVGVVALALVCVLAAGASGRYLTAYTHTSSASATNMVFASNYLTDADPVPSYTVYANHVDLTFANFDSLGITAKNITYAVSLNPSSSNATLMMNGESADGVQQTLTGSSQSTDIIELRKVPAEDLTVEVTATVSTPYTKTMRAAFVFGDAGDNSFYTLTQYSGYALLEVYTGASQIDHLHVQYTNFTPDSTNERMPSSTWSVSTGGVAATHDLCETGGQLEASRRYSFAFFGNGATSVSSQVIASGGTIYITGTV